MKKILPSKLKLLAALLLTAGPLLADEKIPVAIFNFTVTSTANRVRQLAPKITSLVTAELSTNENLLLVERADLSKALQEQALGLSGTVDVAAAAKVGQMTGAKVLVAGHGFKTVGNKFVVSINIIGAESGRLFVEKAEGSAEQVVKISSEVSRIIAKTIIAQSSNLLVASLTREQQMNVLLKSVKGDKRPAILFDIREGPRHVISAETELGVIFQKAGFPVVDEKSDQKPEITISGLASCSSTDKKAGRVSTHAIISIKARQTATGKILLMDSQESTVADADKNTATATALFNASDALAAKLLPMLSQEIPDHDPHP